MNIYDSGKKIAVIGAGVAGLTASYLLSKKHHVFLFDKQHYCGGHANTITINNGVDEGLAVDTGFIVFNKYNYPTFLKLLAELEVDYIESNMSFSYFSKFTNFLYSSDFPWGLFAQKRNLFSPKFYKFILDIIKFNNVALIDVESGRHLDSSLDDYLKHYKFSDLFIKNYVVPMGAAIWSASFNELLSMPAYTFLHFWRNHGLLQVADRPQWYTIKGGSRNYVAKITERLSTISLNNAAVNVRRFDNGCIVKTADGAECYCDYVVMATHADQVLDLLDSPTDTEKNLFSKWSYSKNRVYFHTDTSFLPPKKRCWASWNYIQSEPSDQSPVFVSYYMNRLQSLQTKQDYIVTLNPVTEVNQNSIIRELNYDHPMFSPESIATQPELELLNGKSNVYYCGSYFNYGFHEDAACSGAKVAAHFGVKL
jgi:uncharacterized protein